MHNGLLHRYNIDYKQRFQALVIPVSYVKVVLKLAHDELGHNRNSQDICPDQENVLLEGIEERYRELCQDLPYLPTIQYTIR